VQEENANSYRSQDSQQQEKQNQFSTILNRATTSKKPPGNHHHPQLSVTLIFSFLFFVQNAARKILVPLWHFIKSEQLTEIVGHVFHIVFVEVRGR